MLIGMKRNSKNCHKWTVVSVMVTITAITKREIVNLAIKQGLEMIGPVHIHLMWKMSESLLHSAYKVEDSQYADGYMESNSVASIYSICCNFYRRTMENMEKINTDKIRRLNEKCLELEERIVFLEATIFQFRDVLEEGKTGKILAKDIREFCETVDDYFRTMEALKHGNKIGLA